jgi:4-hydroxy-tetrahydrodipicolinate synthase
MTGFTGIWVPLVTPFRDGAIDFPALQILARHIVAGGVTGLVVCGTTGEPAALSDDEQLAVLDTVLESVPDCPVAMGLSDNNVASALSRLAHMQTRPIAGVLVPAPYYIRPSQAGLLQYFRILAEAASVPIILYNIPYRTGAAMELDTIRALAQHERVVAIKDCGGDPALTMQLIADADLNVLAGEDAQIFSTLCLGGTGAIAASAHIRTDLFVRMAHLVQAGELAEARKIFYVLLPMIQTLFEEPNPGPLKAALEKMGLMRDELRAPMQTASETIRMRLAHELDRLECL